MTWDIYYTGLHLPEQLNDDGLDKRIHHTATIEITFIPPENSQQLKIYLHKDPLVIFLSRNGVNGFYYWLENQGIMLEDKSVTFMAVGEKTAEAVENKFHRTARIPEIQNASGLIQTLQTIPKKPIILITGKETRPELPDWLDKAGWDYCHSTVYSTTLKQNHYLQKIFKNTQNEIIIFTSPSSVLGFLKSINTTNFKLINSRLLSIGPTTTRSIEDHLGTVFLESSRPNLSILTHELLQKLAAGSIPHEIMD